MSGTWGRDRAGTEHWGTNPQLSHCLYHTSFTSQGKLDPALWRTEEEGKVLAACQVASSLFFEEF